MLDKLKEIICDYVEIEPEAVTESASLRNDIGASSFDLMNIAVAVEREFRVSLPDSKIPTVKTVGDILSLLPAKTAQPAS
ncbi:MAG: acyl carrier protein [Clostridia bacterium]|nr:acyl carrier protein [Clostridia bacterium]